MVGFHANYYPLVQKTKDLDESQSSQYCKATQKMISHSQSQSCSNFSIISISLGILPDNRLPTILCSNKNSLRTRVCLDFQCLFYSLTKIEDSCVPQIGDGRWYCGSEAKVISCIYQRNIS